jgi:hypothetical protein
MPWADPVAVSAPAEVLASGWIIATLAQSAGTACRADHEHRLAGLDRGPRQQPEGGGTIVHQRRRHAEVHPLRDATPLPGM